jgi:hypothetical protein
VAWTVNVDLVTDWLNELDDDSYNLLNAAMEILADIGPALREPLVKKITSSRHNNMKELRPGSAGAQKIRVLFAFDPQRVAVMLVGGDKAGDWSGWYDENVGIADDLFDKHLKALEVERKKKRGKKR